MAEQKQVRIIKGTEHTEEFRQKDKCPECEQGYRTANDGTESTCPTCMGTGEKKLDSPELREKLAEYLNWFSGSNPYIDWNRKDLSKEDLDTKERWRNIAKEFIAFIEPLIEEAKKQERERIMKIFASFGKVQLKKPLLGKEFEALFD